MKTKTLYKIYSLTTLVIHQTTSWSLAQHIIRRAILSGEKVEVTCETTEEFLELYR